MELLAGKTLVCLVIVDIVCASFGLNSTMPDNIAMAVPTTEKPLRIARNGSLLLYFLIDFYFTRENARHANEVPKSEILHLTPNPI